MGYYVTLTETNAYIPTEKLDEAYTVLCKLNDRNELKRGGAFPREEKDGPHDGVWFSWMDWNYPETCKDTGEIIAALGFEYEITDKGLEFRWYDNKTGSEDVFIAAIAFLLAGTDGEAPYFVWRGEEGAVWREILKGDKWVTESGRLVFS